MTHRPLDGKIALVTGAGRGIGRAIATRLAEDGADVVILDLRLDSLTDSVAAVEAAGGRALPLARDVASAEDWQMAIASVLEQWGRLDILVNNAGIGGPVSPFLDYPEEAYDQVMAVNTRGVFLGIKYAGRALRDGGGGAIVNIASVSGLSGSRGILAYTASKHAVIGLTKVAAVELAQYKIRVNAVCPAPTATEMMFNLERTVSPGNPDAVRQRFHASIPLARYGEPAEIAATVAFLAGPDSSFITGAALTVDGGMLAG